MAFCKTLVTCVHGSMVGLGTGAPIVQVYHEKSIILPDVSRVLACLYEKDVKFKTHTASYKSLLRLQASSHAPVPFYDGPTFLEESRGICHYIAEKYEHQGYPFLLGKDALERASVEQWLHNEEHAFNPPSRALYCHLAFPLDEEDGDDIDLHTRKLEEVLEVYEQRLSDSRFLAGNKFTLADLVHLPNSHYITSSDKFVYLYDSRKNVSRWWEEISTRKSWQQVLRDMKRVEEQNKQEELKQQQQRRLQKEHPRTSGHPTQIYSRKQTSTEPRTILVPPADTVSPSSLVPPLPTDTFPDEALVSSSQITPTADKSSAVLSKETTVFNAPDKIPPTSVQSTPTTSIEYLIPGQSIKDDSSPTTAKKPPITDAAMSSTKDASIPEPTVRDLHTRYGPSSSKGVSNNLDVFDYHPSHTGIDEETPYIEPTPRRTSETFDAFSGSNIAAGHAKTSSIPAKEEPDQSSVSDFYKSDSRATGIDSRYKESIPYSGRTTRKLEPTDASASKPHISDDYHRLQAEQWHTASTGLHDLKQEADYLMSTQQGKPSKDVKQYPSQDSEQATSHPVPEEPVSMELVQSQEYTTRRPYTDQRSRGIVDDKTSSDQRSALLLPSTQEHDATPSRQEAAKDARGRIPSQTGYRRLQAEQWHTASTGSKDLNQEADHLMSTHQQGKPSKDVKQYPSQDSEQATSHPVPEEPVSMELVQSQEYTTRRPYTDQRSRGIVDDKASSDQRSALLLPSTQEHDATPSMQEATKDARGRIPPQAWYPGGQDTNKQPRDPASVPRQRAAQNARGTLDESKAADSTVSSESSPDASRASLPRQDLDGAHHTTAPFQKRYPATGDTSKQARDKISTPWQMTDKDAEDTTEETKNSDSSSSQEQPLYILRADAPPWKQGTTEDHHGATSAIQEKHANVKDTSGISRDVAFKPKKMIGQTDQDTFKETNGKDIPEETKFADSITSAKPLYRQQAAPPLPRQVEDEDAQSKVRQRRVPIPEPQKMMPSVAQDTHGERKTATPGEQFSDRLQAIPQSRPAAAKDAQSGTGETIQFPGIVDTTNKTRDTFEETKDPDSTLPLLSKEPTSQVQPSLQEAASLGGLSSKPSTIEQWQRASMPLNGDGIGMATIDQKLTPMSQQATPSAEGVNQMARESGEKRVELHVPTEAETSGVQSASPSFPGASTAHHATADDKFVKKSIVDERIGEPTKMQTSTPDSARAHTKRPTPMGHEIGGSELVSIPDGQISEAAKTRRDQAPLQKDVQDVNLPTHDVAKDIFKETKVADSTPSSAKAMYTQRSPPTPRHAELEDTSDKGTKSREIVPERQKMVERRAGTVGEQLSDRLKATPPSRQAPAEDALSATGDTIQSPDILDTSKKARGTYEEAKGPGSMLSKAQSLGAQDAQHTTGESTTPTSGQRKDVSTKPQPDVQDGPNESKLSVADWHGLGSLSSEGKDAIETETTITGEKPFSMERIRKTSKRSEFTTPKAHPTENSQGSVEEKTSSIYQKKPLVGQDSLEQAQTIPAGEKADGSTPKHQRASDDPNTFDEKLNASESVRAKTHDDFSTKEPYREDTTDDQKMAPPLLSRELTSQVQPPSEPSHDAAFHGDLSTKPSTIDQWRRASAPLHDVTTSSGDDEVAMSTVDQKPTPMRLEESDEQRVEPPVPIEAETSGFQRASPSFPGASMDDHATIGDKLAKQSIIDERVGKPMQMQTSTPDAHPASEPTKRSTPEGHGIGDSDGQISEATKARDDPATVHEDVYGVNLPTRDVGKHTFKETKVADSTPSSAKPMYIQQPAITPLRQTQVGEPRDKSMQSRETIPEQQKMVERKAGISGEQSSDRQKAIRPSRQVAADEDAPTGDTIQSPYIPDGPKKSRGTFEEAIGPGSTLPKAQALDAQDSQLTKGESTMPNADQRKDWKAAKDDETTMTEEKSFSTERLREMFQATDSQDYNTVDKTFPVYQKGPLSGQIIQAGEKVDSSTPEHLESSGSPYTYDDKLSAAPARADIRDDHTAEEPHKTYTADDQKVAPSLSSEEPESQMQPLSEPFQRAVPDGDSPSKSFTIDQWQRASAPLDGVSTDSGDAEVAMSSNNDQKSRPMSQEATFSSPVPIRAETSDVGRTVPSLPEAARYDDATIDGKFPKQSNNDERVGAPKQMQEPIAAAHPASASINGTTTPDGHEAGDLKLDRTPEGQRLEAAKATQDPTIIHEDVHDASLSTHDAAIDEKAATHHASGDEPITGYIHDRQAWSPAPTQAQPTVETPHDPDSSKYAHTGDLGKTELAKPIVTEEETEPIVGSTSMDPQRAGTLPAELSHSEQKSAPLDEGSTHAVQPLYPVEPIKKDSNLSAADYSNAPQMIFRQQARPSAPSTVGIPASDTHSVIGKIQEVTPDNSRTDDLGKPFVPSEEQVSHAPQAIPDQEEMASPPGATVSPTSDSQLASDEPRSKEVGDLALSTQIDSTEPRIGDSIVAAPDQAKDSQTTPEPSTYTQDLQGSAYAWNVPADSLRKIESPEHLPTDQAMAPIMSPSVPSITPLGTIPGTNSVQPPQQASIASTVDLESVRGTQHGIPEGEATPAEQKFAISDQEPQHTLEPLSSAEPRKEEANVAAGDQPNVPQGPEKTVRNEVKAPSSDAREALRKNQQPSRAVLPELDSSVADKETTLLSSQAQTSAAEPDSTPISGDVSPTSSLQNQGTQPPVVTQAPTTQSLQGSSPTQDDSLRKFEPPKQASTNQVMEPVTSSTAPSDAPQEKGSARAAQQLSPVEPINADSNVAAADYTNAQQMIFRDQARPSAPSTIGIPASDIQGVIGKIEEGTLDNRTDDSVKPSVPNQEQVSHVSQAIPGEEKMASPPGATVSPTEVQEVSPDDQQAVESSTPLFSRGKQGSRVGSTFVPGEVGPVEKKFTPSDQGLPHSAEQPTSGKPRKEQTGVPTAEQIKEHTTIIGQQDTLDPREVLTSKDVLDATPTHGDVHLTGSIEPERGSLSVQGEEPKSATQAPPPRVAKDSLDPEDISTNAMGNVQSLKPSTTPDARGITPGNAAVAKQISSPSVVAKQISSPSGQDSVDPVEPAFSLGPRNEDIRDSAPSALLISSTDPSKEDSIVSVPDQVKDSQTTPSQQDILSAQRPSGKVEENTPGDNSGNDKSLRPSAIREGIPPSTQLNSTTEPRNGDAIIASPDQAKDSQTTPGQQVRLSAPSSYTQHPSGTPPEDEPVGNSGRANPFKLPSVSAQDQVAVDEEKVVPSGHFTVPAPGKQYGSELLKTDVDGHKVSPLVQDSVHSVQPSFSTEPTKEDSVVAATDQTSTLENIIDQNGTTSPDASRETQKSTDDDHIDEKLLGQGRVSPYSHLSESPEGPIPQSHGDVVDKETTLGSSQAETSKSGPDSTIISGDAHLSSGDVAASSSLPETHDLQGSAYAQNVPADSLGKSESPGHLSADQAMEPRMSPSAPSVVPLGAVTGTDSFQLPKEASLVSTGDLESVGDTQHGITRGEGTPVEQKFTISDQQSAHTMKLPSSAEPSKEEAHATADQPNVPQGPETTVQHQVKAPSPDARGPLQKDQQSSRDDDHISNSANQLVSEEKASHAGRASEGPSSEVSSAVDKKMTLPSSQVQTSSTRPDSTPMSGGTHLSSVDVPTTSSLQNEEVDTPAATRVPTPQAPLDSASTQNVPADSLGEIIPAALSDAPQDQVSHASEPLFSAEPINKASHAGRASESREGTTPEMRSPVVDAKTRIPSRQVQTAKTGPDSTPFNGDVPDRSPLQNQEAQPSAATEVPTVQAEGSASANNEPDDSLGDIKSLRQLPTDEVVAPTTRFAAPSDSSQGTEPGTNSVQPSGQSSFDFKSDEKPTVTQGDQAKTVPHGDLPTSQVVGQSESADSKQMDSQKNLKGASTDENPKTQQQIEQFNTGPFEDSNKEADGTVRSNISTTFEELQKQPSWPKQSMQSSDEPENQQQANHTIVHSLEGNGNQAEQTKAHYTETGGPEDMEASENTNQKNNRISQEETSDHSRKEASGVQWSGENTKDAPNSTEDAPGDVQPVSKSKESSRFSEESKVQLQSEYKASETEAESSKTGQPRGDIPANTSQNNSSQSQAEASDKSVEQSYPGIQNKDRDSSRLDGSADPTKLGDVED
ncbi:unnamed protein product [Urochloa decumbens]|uniref:glutathione transferase n=1 Tax=Urochloa decumbens TaxID=240449 RepID=A0ABC9ETH0_9POAL